MLEMLGKNEEILFILLALEDDWIAREFNFSCQEGTMGNIALISTERIIILSFHLVSILNAQG